MKLIEPILKIDLYCIQDILKTHTLSEVKCNMCQTFKWTFSDIQTFFYLKILLFEIIFASLWYTRMQQLWSANMIESKHFS